jgi:hypothetical protein
MKPQLAAPHESPPYPEPTWWRASSICCPYQRHLLSGLASNLMSFPASSTDQLIKIRALAATRIDVSAAEDCYRDWYHIWILVQLDRDKRATEDPIPMHLQSRHRRLPGRPRRP